MAILNEIGQMKELVLAAKAAMEEVVEHGEELVLLIPYGTWINYPPKTWEGFCGLDHVEYDETLKPDEWVLMSRSEYLRNCIKSLGEKECESNGNQERKDN